MKILIPILLSEYTTNVPENDYAQWAIGTTYNLGDRVIVLSEHNVYESLASANVGNTPSTTPTKWALVGKTNAYKAIDDKVSTQTVYSGDIIMEFPTLKSTSLAFLNTQCTSITVEVLNGTDVIYSKTQSGRTRKTNGWYSYFFGDFEFKPFFLFEHIYNPNGTYRVTISGAENKVGIMVRGNIKSLGCTTWKATKGFTDYSKYNIDQWGETYLKEGNFRYNASGEVAISTPLASSTLDVFVSRRGKLTLFIPTDRYDLNIYGYVRETQFIWGDSETSFYTLDIQGVA